MNQTKSVILEPVKAIGQLDIFKRKNRGNLPLYVVGLKDRLLEDFRRLRSAEKWCKKQPEGQSRILRIGRMAFPVGPRGKA